jgi:hypothetical protein
MPKFVFIKNNMWYNIGSMRTKYIFAVAILSIFAVFIAGKTTVQAFNKSDDNAHINEKQMYGYAWSSNIGWISFNNCTGARTGCSGFDYGVSVDATGNMHGFAWSSSIGWISFNEGCPTALVPGCFAQPKLAAMIGIVGIRGWAKALSAGDGSGGWNGWIALSSKDSIGGGTWHPTVDTSSGIVDGYAWGSDIIGWISFNCSNDSSCTTSSQYSVNMETGPTTVISVTLNAVPLVISSGGSSTLTWTTTNSPTSCTASDGWAGSKATTGGSGSVSPTSTTSYTITCSKSGFSDVSSTVTVTIDNSIGPTVTLSGPLTVTSGNAPILTWDSNNATTCTSSPVNFLGSNVFYGSGPANPITVDTAYTYTCSNYFGSRSANFTVRVTDPLAPTVTLTATPPSISSGGSSTLTWTTTKSPTSCTASGGWTGSKATTSGSESVSPTSTTSYTITCSKSGYSDVSSAATVTVKDVPYCILHPTDPDCNGICFPLADHPECVNICTPPTDPINPLCKKKPAKPIFKEL